jgi:hypothetical protein
MNFQTFKNPHFLRTSKHKHISPTVEPGRGKGSILASIPPCPGFLEKINIKEIRYKISNYKYQILNLIS